MQCYEVFHLYLAFFSSLKIAFYVFEAFSIFPFSYFTKNEEIIKKSWKKEIFWQEPNKRYVLNFACARETSFAAEYKITQFISSTFEQSEAFLMAAINFSLSLE